MNNAGFAVLPSHAGVDEAGRGCLVGSVFAAAVILPADFDLRGLTDSKKLSEKSATNWRCRLRRRLRRIALRVPM